MSTDLKTTEGTESRELVHFVTQQTRFALVNNILQHPKQLPSMYELEELNPSVSDATVYKHVQKLIEAGISGDKAIPGSFTASAKKDESSSRNTTYSRLRKPSSRSTRRFLTSPKRWSNTRTHLALTMCRRAGCS